MSKVELLEQAGFDENTVPKNWGIIENTYAIRPITGGNGRILVLEDPYKSQFECTQCHGEGHTGEICTWCLGTKWDKGKEENGYCRDCTVGVGVGKLSGRTLGKVICPTCKGTGGIIDVPDESKVNTTTGNILAVSITGINEVKIGDKVIFTNYTGTKFQFMKKDLRIISEKDLLGLVRQLKSNAPGINEIGFADLDNTGTPHV